MDNEMIERCKDAINAFPHWDFNNLEREQLALAVIKAMHEPTEKMVDKGGYTYSTGDGMILDQAAKECWQTMIDGIVND